MTEAPSPSKPPSRPWFRRERAVLAMVGIVATLAGSWIYLASYWPGRLYFRESDVHPAMTDISGYRWPGSSRIGLTTDGLTAEGLSGPDMMRAGILVRRRESGLLTLPAQFLTGSRAVYHPTGESAVRAGERWLLYERRQSKPEE